MLLADLIAGLVERPPLDEHALDPLMQVVVTGLALDSRRVERGDLFVALVGERFDGRSFVADALAREAVAVLGPLPEGGAPDGVTWIEHDEPRAILGLLASRIYRAADREMKLVGVTGTNGKSTVSTLVGAVLDAAGLPCGVIGTLGAHLGDRHFDIGGRTTPEAPDLHRVLRRMADAGAGATSMEVSSIALDVGRVDGLAFDVAAFTNLSRDHLDLHGTLDAYWAAKRSLFDRLSGDAWSVVHVGDARGRELVADLEARGQRRLTFGIAEGDIHVDDVTLDLVGIRARLSTPRGMLVVHSRLLGRYNLENLLATVAIAEALEIDRDAILSGLAAMPPVDGRLEPVRPVGAPPFPALIDYAHTPAALEAALGSLREIAEERRIALVFGCGGDRDQGKRRPMGEAAGRFADHVVVTSDNPRREDPAAILDEAAAGVRSAGAEPLCVIDRRGAIEAAVDHALAGERDGERWLVLVAGKGHETTQVIGDQVLDFDDRQVLDRVLRDRVGGPSEVQHA